MKHLSHQTNRIRQLLVLCLFVLPTYTSCQSWGKFWEVGQTCRAENIAVGPAFARSTLASTGNTNYYAAAADCSGNIYAVGRQTGISVTYGSGVSLTSAFPSSDNAILVKYNSLGAILWVRGVITASSNSKFNAVAVDSSGNIYAAGFQNTNTVFDYGSGVTALGNATGDNPVLVKFNSSGVAQWARTQYSATANSQLAGVAVDPAGNPYVVGYQYTTQGYDYGNGVVLNGGGSSENAMVIKYDSTGKALWARSTTSGSANTVFNAIAIDANSRIYAAGHLFTGTAPNYGSGPVTSGCSTNCSVLVRYDENGNTLWGTSVTGSPTAATFAGVAVDASGNIYAAGSQDGNTSYNYNGAAVTSALNGQTNLVIVRYNSSGTGIWARSLTAATTGSAFKAVATDGAGNIYAAGYTNNNGTYTFGPGVSAVPFVAGTNAVAAKYDGIGTALWAKTMTNGTAISEFTAATADIAGNVYFGGCQSTSGSNTYDGTLTIAGASAAACNTILLKFIP